MPYLIKPASDRPYARFTLTPDFDEETQEHLIFNRPLNLARVAAPTKLTLQSSLLLPGFSCHTYQTWVVTAEAKQAIECLEPNLHAFFPLEVWQKKTKIGNAYLLYIMTQIDSIIIEKTLGELEHFPPPADKIGPVIFPNLVTPRITLSADLIHGLHLWRGDWRDKMQCFVSNELRASLSAVDVQGIDYFGCALA